MKIPFSFDKTAWKKNGSVTILSVTFAHMVMAILLLQSHETVGATSLTSIKDLIGPWTDLYRDWVLAETLIVSSVMAVLGTMCTVGRGRVLLFIPQQILMFIMALGGMWAAARGHYLDGTPMPWQHIAADQIIYVAMVGAHMNAIVRRCREWD